jgi:hypothetical protein
MTGADQVDSMDGAMFVQVGNLALLIRTAEFCAEW